MAARQLARKLITRGHEWRTPSASSFLRIYAAMHSTSQTSESDLNSKSGRRDAVVNEQVLGLHARDFSDGNEQGTDRSSDRSSTNANVQSYKATFECSGYWKRGGLERRHWMEEDLLDHQDPLRAIGFYRGTEENYLSPKKVSKFATALKRGNDSIFAAWQQGIWGGIRSKRSSGRGMQCVCEFGFSPKNVRFSSTAGETLHDEMGDSPAKIDFGNTYVVDGGGTATVGTGDLGSIQTVSEIAAATVDCSYPTAFLQYLIDYVHIYSGLPWWASIAATTVAIRLITFPIVIFQMKATAQFSLMKPEMEEITEAIRDSGYDPKVTRESQKRLSSLYEKYQVSPISPLLGVVLSAPIFLCFFFGVKNMAERMESFKGGGTLWFTDLTIPDSTYILPILTAALLFLTVELGTAEGMEGNPMAHKMKNWFRVLAVIMLPISASFQSALFCYWLTSNIFSLFQGIVLRRKNVKLALGIPETSHLTQEATVQKPVVTLSHRPRKVQGGNQLSKHVQSTSDKFSGK